MWKKLGAVGVLLLTAALWGACAGETYVDVEIDGEEPCDSQRDCDELGFGMVCKRDYCWCPEGTVWCSARQPGSDDYNRKCHPPTACTDEHHVDEPPECETPKDC